MSYISAWRIKNEVYVWERHDSGRVLVKYPCIFDYYTKDPEGKYLSVFGDRVTKHSFDNYWEFNKSLEMYRVSPDPLRYESDIGPELKVLSANYYNVEPPTLNITLYDIEVDYDETIGFSSIENPYAPVNAIALYHEWSQTKIVLAIPPKGWNEDDNYQLYDLGKETGTEVRLFTNERDLLQCFVDEIQDSDCISGWNSSWFDDPYICKRIELTLGKKQFARMAFEGASPPRYRTAELYGQERITVDFESRIGYDYMELFKKFEMGERPSYSLEAISNEILPDLPKLEYTGTLAQLYNNDFVHFVRYNIRDTEVLKGFEEKLGYIQLANVLYHSSCGQPNQIFGTIKLADLAIINHCHYNLNRVVPDWDRMKEDGQIFGAMVLRPQKGLHDWIGSIDVTSLYPSAIRCNNISPETLIGQMRGVLSNDDRGTHTAWKVIYEGDSTNTVTLDFDRLTMGEMDPETHTGDEWRHILFERKWAISGYGTIFKQNEEGMIPSVLRGWFEQRKKHKKKMAEFKDAAQSILDKYK